MDLGHPDGRGTPVLNIEPGVVERVIRDDGGLRAFSGYGNGVVVRHPDDTWALYAHLDNVAATQGQQIAAGDRIGTMGNSSNGKFRGMGVHLHLELRHRRPNGATPFPGPYRHNNIDPRPWLASKGLTFGQRGGFEVQPGTLMAKTESVWRAMGGVDPYPKQLVAGDWKTPETAMAGVDPYPDHRVAGGWMVPETAMAGTAEEENEYEPPKRHDRDVFFGMTPIEWAAVGTGTLVLTGAGVALFIRRRRR
jgi:hypothetical protein